MLSCQVVLTLISPDFSRRRFQFSNQIPNKISPEVSQHTSAGVAALNHRENAHTVVSKIITPRLIIFSKLIRRGVIYYAGNFVPQIMFVELIMRGNSVSHYVDRLFWG